MGRHVSNKKIDANHAESQINSKKGDWWFVGFNREFFLGHLDSDVLISMREKSLI